MKCLKCQKVDKTKKSNIRLNPHLSHLESWYVCLDCVDMSVKEAATYAHDYYTKNKKHYRKLHVGYKAQPTMSYVKNMLADGRSFKAKEVPDEIAELKREQLKLKRAIKEKENV